MFSIVDALTKLGLIIGVFFCLSPFPAVITAVTKNRKAIQSLSLPATIMGLCCSTTIISFCTMESLIDCQISCGMFIVQGIIILSVMYSFKSDYTTLTIIFASLLLLSYCVFNVFPRAFTDILMLALNTLSCVLMPLDILDKVLKTKDLSYVNYAMNTLGAINSVIWTTYHATLGSMFLAFANSTGFICEMFLGIGCLYANGTLEANHPYV